MSNMENGRRRASDNADNTDNTTVSKRIRRCFRVAKLVLKNLLHGPLFHDLAGRLAVLLHVALQTLCFAVIAVCLAVDAKWWRQTALADSYQSCRAPDTNVETLQLCKVFVDDLESMLKVLATAVAAVCVKFCTATGSICCSRDIANSTRLDQGDWFDPSRQDQVAKAVGRFRRFRRSETHQLATPARRSLSKPCQWRAAVISCAIWASCLACDAITLLGVGYYVLLFQTQIGEYADELFPDAQARRSWGSVIANVTALSAMIALDACMLAVAVLKIKAIDKIPDKIPDKSKQLDTKGLENAQGESTDSSENEMEEDQREVQEADEEVNTIDDASNVNSVSNIELEDMSRETDRLLA